MWIILWENVIFWRFQGIINSQKAGIKPRTDKGWIDADIAADVDRCFGGKMSLERSFL